MIWLTARQYRLPGLVAGLAVGFVSLALLYVALRAREIADGFDVPVDSEIVRTQIQSELGQSGFFAVIGVLAIFLSTFIAVFAGAALLAREFEERTHRLIWTQGISRERWLLSKMACVAAALVLAAAVLSLAAMLSSAVLPPLTATSGRFARFDMEAPVMIGWTLLTFAIGVLYGAVIKRALAALLATLLSSVALRIYFVAALRPSYIPPLELQSGATPPEGAWLFARRFVDASGHLVDPARVAAAMQNFGSHVADYQGNLERYLEDSGIFQPQLFQPAERLLAFEAIEFGALLALSATCALVALWFVSRMKA